MKAAIVLGVSEYRGDLDSIPACLNDANAMKTLLEEINTDEVLIIDPGTKTHVEDQLFKFVDGLKSSSVSELLFYYSGHGHFDGTDFYYLLTDFSNKIKRQTSVLNSDLDKLLRSVEAGLTIKIVDACNSGLSYVKSLDVLKSHLEESKGGFKSCYFMFSSRESQSSHADSTLSFFTRCFLEAITQHENGVIRYRDISNYVADAFENVTGQQPYFILQAPLTEEFFRVTDKIKQKLIAFLPKTAPVVVTEENQSELVDTDLVATVKKDATRYRSEEEAYETLEGIKSFLEAFKFSDLFTELFDYQIEFSSFTNDIPRASQIGHWLQKSTSDEFFAKPDIYNPKPPKTQRTIFDIGVETQHYTLGGPKVIGFHITHNAPYKMVSIEVYPKYPNLEATYFYLIPIFSKTTLALMRGHGTYFEESWGKYKKRSDIEWKSGKFHLKQGESINNFLQQVLGRFEEFSLTLVRTRMGNFDQDTE